MAISDFKFAVVILGAGRSSRMGRPKLLLPWGATSVLGHLLEQWRALGASQIALVMGANDEALEAERQRIGIPTHAIINPAPERGMFSSIQCAAQWDEWRPEITLWVLALGDQPHLRGDTLARLLELAEAERNAVWQPARHGRARHPVILPKRVFRDLRASAGPDLKTFLKPIERRMIEIDDAGLDLDIDTPEDYERARQLAGLA